MKFSSRIAIRLALLIVFGSLALSVTRAHDLFLKLDTYFLAPHSPVSVPLFNGTFAESENAIARDRMLDVSIVGPNDESAHPDESQWHDEDNAAILEFESGTEGTYLIGVSTASRIIELEAEAFNDYLRHDGVVDILTERLAADELNLPARERYSKHVKAIVQVGESQSDAYTTRIGYPVELVPLQNPYLLHMGDTLDVLFLRDGQPVADYQLHASHERFHGHDEEGNHLEAFSGRTDEHGIIQIKLDAPGRWYVRTIFMEKSDEPNVDYESNWATLTFEIKTAPIESAAEPSSPSRNNRPWIWIVAVLGIVGIAVAILALRR